MNEMTPPQPEAGTSSEARLYLIGTPHAELHDQRVTFSHRKPLALLAYLAVTRRIQSRDALAALLWPEVAPSSAYASLRNALWQLGRSPLSPWLAVERDAVSVTSDLWVDVTELEAHLTTVRAHAHPPEALCTACVSHLVEAVSLFQGEFMAGSALNDCADFEEWQFLQAEHLRQDAAYAMETLTGYYSSRGNLDLALAMAQTWSALDSLNEPAHRALMTLYAQTGQRALALHQYDLLLRTLKGARLEAATETVDLYRRIRAGEIRDQTGMLVPGAKERAAAAGPRHNLPAQTTAFVGREEELAELHDLLALPEARLVTLVGPGGIGKTRLALQSCYEQLHAFPDGVCFVALAPVSTRESMIQTIANALGTGFYPQSSVSPESQLLTYLGRRKILLALDNLEQLIPEIDLVTRILEDTPNTKILATSRERLNLRGEWVVALRGLAYAQEAEPDTLAEGREAATSDAAVLFIETARRVCGEFEPDHEALTAIARICRLVEGMPLGIELAAAWTRMLSCTEIAEEVETSLDFLTATLHDLPQRHQSLRAVFARSWGLLSDREQRSFRALAVFRGGFTREAAKTVAHADLTTLSGLMDKSLIRRAGEGRYDMLEVLRQYAEEQLLAVPGEDEAVRQRHASHYLDLLRQMEPPLRGQPASDGSIDQPKALSHLMHEFGNIRSGWHWATRAGAFNAIETAAMGLALFCEMRSRFREGAAMFRDAANALEAQADASSRELLGMLLAIQGQCLCRYGSIREGCAILERAHTLLTSQRESASLALVQILSAYIGVGLSSDERRARLAHGLKIYRERGDRWGTAMAAGALGEFLTQLHDYENAEALLKESLILRCTNGDIWGTAMTLHALAANEAQQEKGDAFARHLEESIVLREQIGDVRGVAISQTLMGHWLSHQGDLRKALALHQQSVQGYREIGDLSSMARALAAVGDIARSLGDLPRAQSALQSALARQRSLDARIEEAQVLHQLGQVTLAMGDVVQARTLFEESLSLARMLGLQETADAVRAELRQAKKVEAPTDGVPTAS